MDPESQRQRRRIRPLSVVVGVVIALSGIVAALPDRQPAPVDVATLSRGHDPGPPADPDPPTSTSTAATVVPATDRATTTTTTRTRPSRPATTSTTTPATTTTSTVPATDGACDRTAAWPGPRPAPRRFIPGFEGQTSTGQMWVLSDEYEPQVTTVTEGGFYVMGTDGSALRRLVRLSGRYVWSPDGCWLANNQGGLSLFNPRQGDNILLSGNLGMTFGTPAWSGDSRRIAITVDPDDLTDGDSDVTVFPIDGSSPPTVIRLPGDQIDQAWLPDGRILVLDRNGLWLVRADGTIERRIVTGPLVPGRLVVSPTTAVAAVTQPAQDGTSDDRVVLIDLGGAQATPRPACGEAGIVRTRVPVWSPAGDRLACPIRIDGRAAVMLVPVDGTAATLLDDDFDAPDWVGNRLVGVDHTGALVAIDADGTNRTVLSRFAGFPVNSPALSRSGHDIAFTIR